jgi:hypothetical protein
MSASQPSLGAVLDMAMSLPTQEQRQLAEAISAIAGGPVARAEAAVLSDAMGPDVHEWLQSIRDNTPWSQLQLLDASLADALPAEDAEILRAARAELLAAHPQISARNVVRNLVVHQPIAFVVGGVGLVFAVLAVGRTVFRLVF